MFWLPTMRIGAYALLLHSTVSLIPPRTASSISPSEQAARQNAFRIFNAVHHAVRQWGSSLDHNGMSFFLATVPEGNVFYHGTRRSTKRPDGFEWLAFEIEHAQVFAGSIDGPHTLKRPSGSDPGLPPSAGPDGLSFMDGPLQYHAHGMKGSVDTGGPNHQHLLGVDHDDDDGPKDPPTRRPFPGEPVRGYLQTYRAARPLNLIYIDGMAAGKSDFGTLDTQDYVLLDWDPDKPLGPPDWLSRGDWARADELCKLADEWTLEGRRVDGFLRMEAGFEIIYCHFEDGGGLDLVSATASPFSNETGSLDPWIPGFEWMRASSLRYDGLPAGRVDVDWSSMVSAFFYDVNLTNPDASRQDLPRILNTTREERRAVRSRIHEVLSRHKHRTESSSERNVPGIDWQGIVDLVVTRYSDWLALIVGGEISVEKMRSGVNFLLSPFVDYEGESKPLVNLCKARYLEPALVRKDEWTTEDRLIYTAIEVVKERICSALAEMWEILNSDSSTGSIPQVDRGDVFSKEKALDIANALVAQLAWGKWKECGGCSSTQEICFVAMFPLGSMEDHYTPRCKDTEALRGTGSGYWIPHGY